MARYAAVLAYWGVGFCGWQRQDGDASGGRDSIQETVESAIFKITQERVSVTASGRTDAGVHSCGQVAHFDLVRKAWSGWELAKGLNAVLPSSIRVMNIRIAPNDFDARRDAVRKQYSYYFVEGVSGLPGLDGWVSHEWKPLDVSAMNRAAQDLVGEHDFEAFKAKGAVTKTSRRQMFESEVTRGSLPLGLHAAETGIGFSALGLSSVRFRIVGSGFLKQMVRSLAGTLREIGQGKRPAEDLRSLLDRPVRADVGTTAPAKGLWHERVWYTDFDPYLKDAP